MGPVNSLVDKSSVKRLSLSLGPFPPPCLFQHLLFLASGSQPPWHVGSDPDHWQCRQKLQCHWLEGKCDLWQAAAAGGLREASSGPETYCLLV